METGIYSLVLGTSMSATLRDLGIDLVDVNYVLRTGSVVRSDMAETKGRWEVRGRTVDDITLEMRIAVVSSEYEVELLRITTVDRRGK